jgi:uncharacterized protein YbgA (DUF1722 family)/uncharacterized protein YbbK (DUF523 family)
MTESVRPRVLASRCLGYAACRYDGSILRDEFLERLEPHVDLMLTCPEEEIGLGTPRAPIRLVSDGSAVRLVQPSTGRDVTEAMTSFAERLLSSAAPQGIEIDGFVLKSRSPSCGIGDVKIHVERGNAPPRGKGPGLFARAVLERFPHAAIEEEGRLLNLRLREHFLTKLFALAEVRAMGPSPEAGTLVRFQSQHELLLLAYNQKQMRTCGRIVANRERLGPREIYGQYAEHFRLAFARPPRHASPVNVCTHAMGYFSEFLGASEKRHFLRLLDRYTAGKVPLSVPVGVLRSWIARFENEYLAGQSFFEPFPEELVDLFDSGKGRAAE